jgi:hypothetical protein
MKKEVFDVLEVAYPNASEAVRRRVVTRIEKGFKAKLRKRLGPETSAYEQFNILVWLRKADAKCPLVADAIAKIQKSHPNFVEREHPAFDHWHGDARFIDPKEGFNIDQILSEPPARFLDKLLNAEENSFRHDRWDHLSLLPALFGKNKEWGKGFTEALASRENPSKEIWNGVFSAWKQTVKTKEDWAWILEAIEGLPELPEIFAGLASLVSDIWRSEAKSDDVIINKAAAFMDRAWKICSKIEETPDDSYREWLTSAINHEGGWIGEFWVHYCSRLREQAGTNWKGIPSDLKSKIREALQGTSRIKVYARIAMTPWMGYLFAWDRQFTTDYFFPLLDWQRDAVVAQQTWSVLLNYRQVTFIEMEEQLLPYYRQVADRITMLKDAAEKADQFDEHALHNLGHYLAGLAMGIIQNPINAGFFRDFLPRLSETVRGALAQGMGNFLKASPPEKAAEIWNLWLKEYLDSRLIGVPLALSDQETKAMVEWCLPLGAVFPEVVQRVLQMRLKDVFAYGIVEKLLKSQVLESFPRETCRYVNAVLKAEDHPFLHEQHTQLHDKFKQTISGTPEFNEFEELLYLRGWKK